MRFPSLSNFANHDSPELSSKLLSSSSSRSSLICITISLESFTILYYFYHTFLLINSVNTFIWMLDVRMFLQFHLCFPKKYTFFTFTLCNRFLLMICIIPLYPSCTLTHGCLKVHGGVPIVLCIFVDPLQPGINRLVFKECLIALFLNPES